MRSREQLMVALACSLTFPWCKFESVLARLQRRGGLSIPRANTPHSHAIRRLPALSSRHPENHRS